MLKLRNDNVLVRLDPVPETTRSGLVALPQNQNRRDNRAVLGVVLAVGPGHWLERMTRPERADWERRDYGREKCPRLARSFVSTTVRPGDRVILEHFEAGELYRGDDADGDERIVRETEILAVLEPEEAA